MVGSKENGMAGHFGRQVRKERLAHGWSLDELSRRTGINAAHLSRIENGRRPPTEALARACDAAFPERRGWFSDWYDESRTWAEVPPGFREAVEAACNTEVAAGRRIDARVLPRDEAFAIPDIIRTATNLVPPEVKEVRIIDIVGLDQQADGGTHVATTSQIGRIEVVKIESKGKGFRRLRIRVAD